jgi:DNA-binding PadR family transcriptional regulator
MNLTRLMALGILARSGPSHGHHIRRVADVTNVGEWGGVSVGALYRELRAMEREGLVEAARTEKVGNRPERTVYAITAEGQLELTTLREQAIRPLGSGLDPLGVALLFAADGMDTEELRRTLRARREMLAIAVGQIAADREQLIAKGFLDLLAAAVMRRGIMTTEAEIRWHDELDAALATAGEGATRGRVAGGPPLSLGEGAFDITADIAAPGPAAGGAAAEGAGAAPGAGTGPDTGQDAGPAGDESR